MPPKSRKGTQNQSEVIWGQGRGRGRGRGRGHETRGRGRARARNDKVPVINLDGASASDESDMEEENTIQDKGDTYFKISSPLTKQNYLTSSSLLSIEESDDDDFILENIIKLKKKGNGKKDSDNNHFEPAPPKKTRRKQTPKQANKQVTDSKDKSDVVPAEKETEESRTGDSDDDDKDNSLFVINPQSTRGIDSDDESDDFNPFAANYGANVNIAQSEAEVEDHELEEELEQQKQKELERLQKLKDEKKKEKELLVIDEAEKSDVMIIDDDMENLGRGKRGRNTCKSAQQETTAPDCEIIQTGRSLKKISRKTHAALKRFDKIAGKMENDSFNISFSSDILEVEEDEDEDITLRLKQGREYFKHTMDKNEKFSVLFQELAEKHKVSVRQIFLTLNHEYLDPEKTPKDLGITLADVIELGVMSAEEDSKEPTTSSDANSISFRVQTSNRKDSITVTISRYDKMQVLMNKYAKEKSINISELRFYFDGEALEANETPISLDLEGGECIDVFPKK